MLRLGLACVVAVGIGAFATVLGLNALGPRPMPPATIALPDTPPQLASTPADAAPHHLPASVQTRQVAPLWSGSDDQAIQFTRLPTWTFLKVTGASVAEDRLQVVYAGDGAGRQAGPGWVAAADVQPSDAGGNWLRNYRASRLFADTTSGSPQADLPPWSSMVTLDDTAAGDRVHVRAYSPALSNVVAEGWVPATDVGPTGRPFRAFGPGRKWLLRQLNSARNRSSSRQWLLPLVKQEKAAAEHPSLSLRLRRFSNRTGVSRC